MSSNSVEWSPDWRLNAGQVLDSAEAKRRLDYCLEWRAWLWRKPTLSLLHPFEQFRGKRVLEFGARYGRMSCLLAAAGAQVTGVDLFEEYIGRARQEAERWNLGDRVRFCTYDGNFSNLPQEKFDFIFSKSVLVVLDTRILPELFRELRNRLVPGGSALFLENANNWILDKYRRFILHRGDTCLQCANYGFYPQELNAIGQALGSAKFQRHLGLVWSIRAQVAGD